MGFVADTAVIEVNRIKERTESKIPVARLLFIFSYHLPPIVYARVSLTFLKNL
jgi:hypothetical protein